jgi:DNA repair protein RadA/Sms
LKAKNVFYCRECGASAPRWLGRCPACGLWNTLEEVVPRVESSRTAGAAFEAPVPLFDAACADEPRLVTGIGEFDRVLGGGLVQGSVVLLGGDPGIGKSTLLLAVSHRLSCQAGPVLYVTGEESVRQVHLRASRLGALDGRLLVLAETEVARVGACLENEAPVLAVIDSVQTMASEDVASPAGSVSQVREAAIRLGKLAKAKNITILLVGHVTKEGTLAGPKTLEHMVDTVLYLEGERYHTHRILRVAKNRFGSTNDIGIFQMGAEGLSEVTNPSALFLSPHGAQEVAGAVVVPVLEGSRPLLVEIQALVSPGGFGTPRRVNTGVDYSRMVMVMAVLEKRLGLGLSGMDAYVSAVGGVHLDEPPVDLGMAVALASSFREACVSRTLAVMGEIGLTGEVRAVTGIRQRVIEARRLGFDTLVLPDANRPELVPGEPGVVFVATLAQAIEAVLP